MRITLYALPFKKTLLQNFQRLGFESARRIEARDFEFDFSVRRQIFQRVQRLGGAIKNADFRTIFAAVEVGIHRQSYGDVAGAGEELLQKFSLLRVEEDKPVDKNFGVGD